MSTKTFPTLEVASVVTGIALCELPGGIGEVNKMIHGDQHRIVGDPVAIDMSGTEDFARARATVRTSLRMMRDNKVGAAAVEWARARAAYLSLSALPIGNPDFRVALNRLSNAEDELFKLARE